GARARRSAGLEQQRASYQRLHNLRSAEQRSIQEGLAQADERLRANEQLYTDRIISRQEYYEEGERLRQQKLALQAQERAGLQNTIADAGTTKALQELRLEQESLESDRSLAVRECVRNLQNFTQDWRRKYLLLMPYPGHLHFLRPLQRNES